MRREAATSPDGISVSRRHADFCHCDIALGVPIDGERGRSTRARGALPAGTAVVGCKAFAFGFEELRDDACVEPNPYIARGVIEDALERAVLAELREHPERAAEIGVLSAGAALPSHSAPSDSEGIDHERVRCIVRTNAWGGGGESTLESIVRIARSNMQEQRQCLKRLVNFTRTTRTTRAKWQ